MDSLSRGGEQVSHSTLDPIHFIFKQASACDGSKENTS